MAYLPVMTVDPETHHVTITDNGLVIAQGPDGLTARLQYASGGYALDTGTNRGDARHQAETAATQAAWQAKLRTAIEALAADARAMPV